MSRIAQTKETKHGVIRTVAELCLLAGLAVGYLPVTIFDLGLYVEATGGILFVIGYALIKFVSKEERVWSAFEFLLIAGIVLGAIGVFWNLRVVLLAGLTLLAVQAIRLGRILEFGQQIVRYFVKSCREMSDGQ